MNILLMCQGQQRRLPLLKGPKHLLELQPGQTILGRTLDLLAAWGAERAGVVGAHDELARVAHERNGPPLGSFHPAPDGLYTYSFGLANPGICIVDGILELITIPPVGRTLILLGDVVWSKAALEAVLADRRPVVFAGTPVLSASQGEVFALGFDNPQEMRNLCASCPCRMDGSRIRGFSKQQGGHLRRLLWHVQERMNLKVPPSLRRSWHEQIYLPIEDWTKDVDTPADQARLPELARLAELEERTLPAAALA